MGTEVERGDARLGLPLPSSPRVWGKEEAWKPLRVVCVGGVSQALLLPPALLLAAETSHSTACWDQWEALEPGVAFLLQRQGAEGSVPVAEARAPALGQALGRRAGQRG